MFGLRHVVSHLLLTPSSLLHWMHAVPNRIAPLTIQAYTAAPNATLAANLP